MDWSIHSRSLALGAFTAMAMVVDHVPGIELVAGFRVEEAKLIWTRTRMQCQGVGVDHDFRKVGPGVGCSCVDQR